MDDTANVPAATGDIVVATDEGVYREGLSRRRLRIEEDLASADEFGAVTLRLWLSLVDDAAAEANIETSFLAHRARVLEAEAALTEFLIRFDPEQRWEAQYLLRTGDLELVAQAVSDAASALADNRQAGDKAAGEVLVRLGNLAFAGFDFKMAERIFLAAIEQSEDPAVKSRALAAYADLLRAENRNREAREVENRQSQVLQQG